MERINKKSTSGIGQIFQNLLSYYIQKIRKLLKNCQFTYTKVSKNKIIFFILRDIFSPHCFSLLFLKINIRINLFFFFFCKKYNIVIYDC